MVSWKINLCKFKADRGYRSRSTVCCGNESSSEGFGLLSCMLCSGYSTGPRGGRCRSVILEMDNLLLLIFAFVNIPVDVCDFHIVLWCQGFVLLCLPACNKMIFSIHCTLLLFWNTSFVKNFGMRYFYELFNPHKTFV